MASGPGIHAAPAVQAAASAGAPPSRGPNRIANIVFCGFAMSGEAASCSRPVSMALMAIRSRSNTSHRNLPRRRKLLQPLTHERAHLVRRSAHRERPWGLDRKHAAAGHSGVKGVGENGQVRQLGHVSDCTDRVRRPSDESRRNPLIAPCVSLAAALVARRLRSSNRRSAVRDRSVWPCHAPAPSGIRLLTTGVCAKFTRP